MDCNKVLDFSFGAYYILNNFQKRLKMKTEQILKQNFPIQNKEDPNSHSSYEKQTISLRLYPIPQKFGRSFLYTYQQKLKSCANLYISYLRKGTKFHINNLRSRYGKAPEGFSCNYLEIEIWIFKCRKKEKDKIVWLNA